MRPPPRSRRLLRAALTALVVGVVWFWVHTAVIVVDGMRDEVAPVDVIVVLGNKVRRSGRPSQYLRDRLNRALALYEEGVAPTIIVSGGLGVEGHEEADVMADYLIARGVPASAVIRDRDGWTTQHTARNAREIMQRRGWTSALAVSNYFHVSRVKLAFARVGVNDVSAAAPAWRFQPRDAYSLVREFAGFYVYALRPADS